MPNDAREYWATFSIYDYRTPRFRQALVLFDKVVIPVPDEPIKGSRGEITSEDLDRLSAEVEFLERAGAAIAFTWSRKDFDAWRESKSGEALAQLLDRDRELATRLQVQDVVTKGLAAKQVVIGGGYNAAPVSDASVVPVYARVDEYRDAWRESAVDAKVIEIVSGELPMPDDNEELARIIDLRQRESFRAFMPAFRHWQEEVALRLLRAGGDEGLRNREIRLATMELRAAIEKFKDAVEDARFDKLKRGVTIPLVVGSAFLGHVQSLLAAIAESGSEFFSLREFVQPWWRPLQSKEFALAGVICEAAAR